MKRNLLAGLRALLFALAAFALVALTQGTQIRSSLDVAGFVLLAAVFWFLFERVVIMAKKQPPNKPRPPGA